MKKEKTEKKKLLVIGNGFDLQCGIRSSFSGFFEEIFISGCKEKFALYKSKLSNEQIFVGTNFWVLWLFFRYYRPRTIGTQIHLITERNPAEIKWMDVEQCIKDVFAKVIINEETLIDILKSDFPPIDFDGDFDEYIGILYKGFHNLTKTDFLDFLFNQLTEFETAFTEYMKAITKNNQDYEIKKKELLRKLVGDNTHVMVLNFNYTSVDSLNGVNIEEENVHGSLERNNIIIGIDTNEFPNVPDFFRFTKAYRKLELYFSQAEKIKDITNVFKEVDEIEFYGHSFGEQDYTYFKTIFDRYERDDAKHRYVFKFSDYDGRDKNAQKRDLYFLFEKYKKDYLLNLINLKRFNVITI